MKIEDEEGRKSQGQKQNKIYPDSATGASNSMYASAILDSSEDSDEDTQSISTQMGGLDVKNQIVTNAKNSEVVNKIDVLQHVFNATNSGQTLGNVFIERSNGVHIGNITYVTGPIHITQAAGRKESTDSDKKESSESSKSETLTTDGGGRVFKNTEEGEEEVEREESNRNDAFIGNINRAIDGNVLRIVNRVTWLAQRPLEPYEYIDGPAQYVIISHTGTEEGTTQAENVYLVRNIQCFHIESRRWNDIAYNFLVGSDGNVYEGRGWKVVGAHTYGYNKKSVGISFIGCFMRDKAPEISIKACKLLIKRGIELGHIRSDYILLAHCQCSATESPGRMLFEELQTWPHFSEVPSTE